MPRAIDHLVVAVRDLEGARTTWERLGFTAAPIAQHPFGTANAVIQLQDSYIELVAVTHPERIPVPAPNVFSFSGFTRDFLERREGMSMLALQSEDAAADRAEFEKHGFPVFAPLHFERMATGPDGVERPLEFSVTFTREPRLKQAGFLTCRHHKPENFWRSEYQQHRNGATAVAAAILVSRDPADFHEFLTYFTGQRDMKATSLGVSFETGGGEVEVTSPVGFEARFGEKTDPDPRRFLGCRIAVRDLEETVRVLEADGVLFGRREEAVVVPSAEATGLAVAFVRA